MTTTSDEHIAFLASMKGRSQPTREALWKVRRASNPTEMFEAEREVHQALRDDADSLVGAALKARVRDREFVEEARAEVHRLAKRAGVALNSRGSRPTSVRLLGGGWVSLAALHLSPATPNDTALRRKPGERGPSGSGVYPALARLGASASGGRGAPVRSVELR